ncbi:hypothetical protein ACRALDRAFT_2024669 [Sodiomyces alcalophilus JCM 7366]|uniref:uncharacterized protein n=1 Tax=Sodiomyces alcalophilus JCM 7366 TaxID=591952 RepID=UPI0039B5971E
MPVEAVVQQIRNGTDFASGRFPLNLLNLKFLGQAPPGPAFLNARRFSLIPAINSRLEADWTGEVTAGKRTQATMLGAREIDLVSSMTFSLFAQRGSMTGFHVDVPDGTWIRNCWGLKVWIFPEDFCDSDTAQFQKLGHDWVPNAVRFIVLEPGDTLVMPAGRATPHAVLTLEDSHMVGGMFLDANCVLGTLRKLLWVTENPNAANEAIPLQLLSGWHHLRDLFLARGPSQGDVTEFDSLTNKLRDALSCSCTGPCEKILASSENAWLRTGQMLPLESSSQPKSLLQRY